MQTNIYKKSTNFGGFMEEKIPNFNSFSTIVDRLSIENVKLAHFEYLQERGPGQRDEIAQKIVTQKKIIEALKNELSNFMLLLFEDKEYKTLDEKRTFE